MSLKRLYNLREMAVVIPDEEVEKLRKVVGLAVKAGKLPPNAGAWLDRQTSQGGEPEGQTSSEPPADQKATAPAAKKARKPSQKSKEVGRTRINIDPETKASLDRAQSVWDKFGDLDAATQPGFRPQRDLPAVKPPEFDPMGMHPDYGNDLDVKGAKEPPSANFKVHDPDPKRKTGPDGFDPMAADPDYNPASGTPLDVPDWAKDHAPAKPSGLARVFGKKPAKAEPSAMKPNQSALSRVFGKKSGGPDVPHNPEDDTGWNRPDKKRRTK